MTLMRGHRRAGTAGDVREGGGGAGPDVVPGCGRAVRFRRGG